MNLPELTIMALVGFLVLMPLGLYLEVRFRPAGDGSRIGSPRLRDLGRSLTALACVPICLAMLEGQNGLLAAGAFFVMGVYYLDQAAKQRGTLTR